MTDAPMTRPGEVAGRPKLVVRYPTDPGRIADLLPPGLEPVGEPVVQIGIYCVPVHGEPEYGVSTKVPARFDGTDGHYTLGIGIDQEQAIFISRETNGQPKFPCSVRFFRLGDEIHASATHQGHTFLTYRGVVTGSGERVGEEFQDDEWWIKVSRAVGGVAKAYDFPPHVVRVRSAGVVTHIESLTGEFTLNDSDWDPYTALLPQRGPATAELVTARHTAREITLAGPLDPDAFWPYADTIGGSRWPGEHGGPIRRAAHKEQ
ncbi:MAG: acetoacetate decarboxylase family protein [Acidimicrobiales bacterium]